MIYSTAKELINESIKDQKLDIHKRRQKWINKMLDYGCFKKLGHNKYQLNESVIDELVKAK